MDDNDIDIVKVERKIYTKEVLSSLRSSELSNAWPKSLDKCCVNSYGQWDPVKSFDGSKPSDTKKTSLYESKSYRNNDKNKDDISLRPERRKWNDGCQVSNTKRNNEDNHCNSYRKSYQNTTPSNGGGDYERRSFNRSSVRNVKPRDSERENKYNSGIKPEKSSRNNSNLEERKDDKDSQCYVTKNSTNLRNNNSNNEPEWFSNGPENCDETIELRGITANDSAIIDFKKDSTRNETKQEPEKNVSKENDKIVIDFPSEKPVFIEPCITSPKREGSRFQDIFQKETKNNYLKESKDVENIIKAVLSENVSKIDSEKLTSVSKPLPNGVLTVEEIEKGMTSSPVDFKRAPSKSATIDTLPSFDQNTNSYLAGDVSIPSVDNYKVVNWLSNLNIGPKEPDLEPKQFFSESQNSVLLNNAVVAPINYQKFAPNLQHPPGLPLMLNPGHVQPYPSLQQQQQQSLRQQQQQFLQHQHSIQQQQLLQHQQQQQQQQSLKQVMPQHLSLQQTQAMHQSLQNQKQLAFMKQLSLGSTNNVNMAQRNHIMNIPNDAYIAEKYKLTTQQSLPNDPTLLPNFLLKTNLQMNHITDRNDMMTMNVPPGLASLSNNDKSMLMSRPIVKTNPPFMDFAQVPDLNYPYQNSYRRAQNTITNPCNQPPPPQPHIYLHNADINKQAQYNNNIEIYRKLHPAAMLTNNYPHNQQMPFDGVPQRSSSKKMLDNLFNVSSSHLPPLPQQAKYADQIETENI